MATLFEYYNTNDDQSFLFYGVGWQAQTFTPTVAHTITSVKLKLLRVGTPGTFTVSIRAADGDGKPTGSDLCSGTSDGDTLTTDIGGEWREITFGDGIYLNTSVKYAIVVRVPGAGGPTDMLRWREDNSSPTYANGYHLRSTNSGSTWIDMTGDDMMFEDWGTVLFQAVDSTIVGDKVSLEAIRNLEIVYGGRFYISKSGLAVYESRYHRNA